MGYGGFPGTTNDWENDPRYKRPENLTDVELIARLTDSYGPEPTPRCRVCGEELTIGAMGGGKPTEWSCSGQEDDPDRPGHWRYKPGRSFADDHYQQSRHTQYRRPSSDIMELIARFQKVRAGLGG